MCNGVLKGPGGRRKVKLGRCERQQGDIARPFDGHSHLPLMLGAVAGNPPGNDLPAFCDEEPEDSWVLIINGQFLVGTESTDFSSQEGSFLTVPSRPFSRSFHHHRHLLSSLGSSSFSIRRSVAITSMWLRLFPSGVCQRRCFKRPSTLRLWPFCKRSSLNSAKRSNATISITFRPDREDGSSGSVTSSENCITEDPSGRKERRGDLATLPVKITRLQAVMRPWFSPLPILPPGVLPGQKTSPRPPDLRPIERTGT